ncbi:hypothetical protein [uncultured Olegusella sp.]|uniref:hypothetical protein n=1 Tax=uncultured Olegusella sp. TaxID=1979846 RepID=UPI0026385B39|nr:hypothetical protein [uncultured Olegusella sp.]
MTTGDRLRERTFKKCDLHIHSSSCYSRSYTETDFMDQVASSDLDVIAITDHNSVDVKLLNAVSTRLSSTAKVLMAGVELNIKLKPETIREYHLTVAEGHDGKYFHAVLWCSLTDADALSERIDDLFANLPNTQESLKDEVTEGRITRSEYSKRIADQAVFLEDVQEALEHIPHFFVPHENKGDRNLSDYLPIRDKDGNFIAANDTYKDSLFYYSHALAVEGGERSRNRISANMAKALNTTVASLLFSDALTLGDIGAKFTWIDFDGDLDSLLLAISDPESRIYTSDKYPSLPQTNTANFLESVSFKTFQPANPIEQRQQTIVFSPGYNGIVGSRGSGKTMLARILARRDIEDYRQFVDPNSIRFKRHGGVATSDHPKYLYLNQGALETVFSEGDYHQIPFLDDRISPMTERVKTASDKAYSDLSDLLEMEQDLLLAFSAKYAQGIAHIDFLDLEKPSGVAIETHRGIPSNDDPQIDAAKKALGSFEVRIDEARRAIENTHLKAVYPENENLFAALETELDSIKQDANTLRERATKLSSVLDDVDMQWFECRTDLLKLFSRTVDEFNSGVGASAQSDYNSKAEIAAGFLDDLLSLRIVLSQLDDMAASLFQKMLGPIAPEKLTNGDDCITLSLYYEDESSYSDHVGELISTRCKDVGQPLVKACLLQAEVQKVKQVFNGTKIKNVQPNSFSGYLDKYFSMLQSSFKSSQQPQQRIELNGLSIEDMSPGMRAEALLKLFLHDGIAEEQYTYVILDQPEDNLDAVTIKRFLIDRLKELKLGVQFFVVSHSAPVIVNGDARTIIVCENVDGDITYKQGAMNESPIKQSIADVLDGGERYLKMRLNKYNFQARDKR